MKTMKPQAANSLLLLTFLYALIVIMLFSCNHKSKVLSNQSKQQVRLN
ncbi:MAG: hypothetical protein KA198_03370 [Chitinophagaceae bacterium]|nr:hypothetical protein [Chitinophagaceae bacterium]